MTLTLRIRNVARLDNGMPVEFVLHQRGAMIGRSPTCDWCLPDPRSYISSRHCEVAFAGGFYTLTDLSTNGTILNGGGARMAAPRRIEDGDVFLIGQYEVAAALTGEASAAVERRAAEAAAAQPQWAGWESHGAQSPPADNGWGSAPASSGWGPSPSPAPAASGGWGAPAPSPAPPASGSFQGWGAPPAPPPPPVDTGWGPSASLSPPAVASTWEAAPAPPEPASPWSSAVPDAPPPAEADDIWGRIAEGNVVDWARGGFGAPPEPARRDPLGLAKPDPREALGVPPPPLADWGAPVPAPGPVPVEARDWGAPSPPPESIGWGSPPPAAVAPPPPPATPPPVTPPPAAPPPALPSAPAGGALAAAFLDAAGLEPTRITEPPAALLARAGHLFRRLVAGLVVMAEARARAKAQMGAEATSFAFDGNNPIKFARSPEEALTALLNPAARGFMEGERAIEDAFFDLQSHQMATLKAMQGALRATLDRFSPNAIQQRAETRGLIQRIMPGARDAALWQAYVREFGGVAQGSDEAFMDVFAKEFRKAYEAQAAAARRG